MNGRAGEPDLRGNNRDRKRRKRWLLETFGDGETCPCSSCGDPLTFHTLTVDRIVPGEQGGRYTRDNIRPACMSCQIEQGNGLRWGFDGWGGPPEPDPVDEDSAPVTFATPV